MQSKPWYQSTTIWIALLVAIIPEVVILFQSLAPAWMPYVTPISTFILACFLIYNRVTSTSSGAITLR